MWHRIPVVEERENNPYLTKQLIAYIGNKRTLLGFLGTVFKDLESKTGPTVFADPFAGSGAVARLAKSLNYNVSANDWEPYSKIVNSCHIGINKRELKSLFSNKGGVEKVFREINNLEGIVSEPYISLHFAPEDTAEADYMTERLFYTRENALFIDRARTYIEDLYPGWDLDEQRAKEKTLLLSSLLYEVSTHANTSGVFKACHKGFGGHGRDALSRIMAPMEMEIPQLIDSEGSFIIENSDAADFVSRHSSHICYLDPPYNGHQYGSNYFMLNTVALWDKPPVSFERKEDGRFQEKAGIRKDWVKTRSPFCYKKDAPGAFSGLLDSIDSDYVLLSYNTEGIIPFDQLYDIMESHGKTELYCRDYILYRGGKQSLGRQNYNMELLLLLDRKKKSIGTDRKRVQRFLMERKLITLLRRPFNPEKLREKFNCADDSVEIFPHRDNPLVLKTMDYYIFNEMPLIPESLSDEELGTLFESLEKTLCSDNREEAHVLIDLIRTAENKKKQGKYHKRLLLVVRKFAFKKYQLLFAETAREIEDLIEKEPESFSPLKEGIQEILAIAELRFKG